MSDRPVKFPSLGKVADKDEVRQICFDIKRQLKVDINTSFGRIGMIQETHADYMKNNYPWKFRFLKVVGKEYKDLNSHIDISEHFKLVEELSEINNALSILNNRLVIDFYCSDSLCRIITKYKPDTLLQAL